MRTSGSSMKIPDICDNYGGSAVCLQVEPKRDEMAYLSAALQKPFYESRQPFGQRRLWTVAKEVFGL
jgi:hypothetical protein